MHFLKSTVYHSRKVTAENSFHYPVLNFFCSAHLFGQFQLKLRKIFFRILKADPEIYLNHGDLDLNSEINRFIDEKFSLRFDEIVLQSIPKMFGFVFNPISFWYCYNSDILQGVLCEVRNTFNEKHYYWLYQNGQSLLNKWIRAEKQFHVSPFFTIEGFYQFRFIQTSERISAEIDFLDFSGNLKLKTWIKGHLISINELGLIQIFSEYAWMTPLVILRIHYQAVKLYLKKVTFIKKPPQPVQEINHESTFISD